MTVEDLQAKREALKPLYKQWQEQYSTASTMLHKIEGQDELLDELIKSLEGELDATDKAEPESTEPESTEPESTSISEGEQAV